MLFCGLHMLPCATVPVQTFNSGPMNGHPIVSGQTTLEFENLQETRSKGKVSPPNSAVTREYLAMSFFVNPRVPYQTDFAPFGMCRMFTPSLNLLFHALFTNSHLGIGHRGVGINSNGVTRCGGSKHAGAEWWSTSRLVLVTSVMLMYSTHSTRIQVVRMYPT